MLSIRLLPHRIVRAVILINEAITNYIELHASQDALVRQGLEEMRRGRVVSHEKVVKMLKKPGRTR